MLKSVFKNILFVLPLCIGGTASATAEVLSASPSHYSLKQEGYSELSPNDLWQRLIKPESWWHPDHTYSGDAANLSLDAKAGGVWSEQWDGGSVEHGRVLLAQHSETLRLDAPFGPLQELGVQVVWTISLKAEGSGTKVTFTEIANGTPASKLDAIAGAVDFVKTEAINRLTTTTTP